MRKSETSIHRKGLLLLSIGLATSIAQAQESGTGNSSAATQNLEVQEIVVKGQALRAGGSAFSNTGFTAESIRDKRLADTQELLRDVQGVDIRNLGLGGVADNISIRGLGGGGHGGDLGAVIDGIPLNEAMSHADGYVDMNVIVPLEIDEMTVYKGPVSALYGNYNRGGLVRVDTRKTGEYRELDLGFGSNQEAELQTALGIPVGDAQQLNLAAQLLRTDGYRPQSESERGTFSGRWQAELSPALDIAISTRQHKAESENAGYLNREQYRRNPDGIDPRVQNDGAEKRFSTFRADAFYDLGMDMRLLAFSYRTDQRFSRWFTRPTGGGNWDQREESYERDVVGYGVNLNGVHQPHGIPLYWVAGAEAFEEQTDYIYFDRLDYRRLTQPAISDRTTELSSRSLFAELQADINRFLMPSLGLRYDRFSGDCERNGPETGSQACEALSTLSHLSPKIGVRSELTDFLEARASWSEGFALPNGFVKYASGASNLDPVIYAQTEIGLTLQANPALQLDLVAYRLRTSDEVRTIAPGEYENFGATERSGLEAAVYWMPTEALDVIWIYGLADSEIRRHSDGSLRGNAVGGVPDYNSSLTVSWTPLPAWTIEGTWRKVGAYDLSAANTARSSGYQVMDMGVSYNSESRSGWRLSLDVDNVFDRRYAPYTAIIGGETVFGPGAPRQLRLGAQLQF